MIRKTCFVGAVLFAAVCSLSVSAQSSAKFVSQDGGFTIDLPREGYQGIEPIGDLTSGAGTYAWVTDQGQFSVSYLEGAFPIETSLRSLNELADTILRGPVNARATLLSRRQYSVDGNPVIELRIRRPQGSAINRLVLVKRRLYVLTADWVEGDAAAPASVLDTFQIVDSRALVA